MFYVPDAVHRHLRKANDTEHHCKIVHLVCEPISEYDSEFYSEQLLRAGASVLSPLGWTHPRIQEYLATDRTLGLGAFD